MAKKKPNTRKPNDRRAKTRKDADPKAALAADLERKKAIGLRLEGYSYREIAAELGVSVETAYRYVNDGWDRIKTETDQDREDLRNLELARCDAMLKRALPLATRNNLVLIDIELGPDGPAEVRKDAIDVQFKAMDRVLKIGKRRADLLGLDAPTKVESTVTNNALEPLTELAKRIKDAKEKKP